MKTILLFCLGLLLLSCKGTPEKKASFPLYQQRIAAECGPACLKMISDFYGGDYNLETLNVLCKMDMDKGTSLGSIFEASETIGLHSLAVSTDAETLYKEVPYPALLHWDGNHFVVIYDVSKDSVWLADPAIGYVTLTKEEFLPHWIPEGSREGFALLFETTEAFFDPNVKEKILKESRQKK